MAAPATRYTTKACKVCHAVFTAPEAKPATKRKPAGAPHEVCGRARCWAIHYLSDEEWQGRKRMAEAKLATLHAADAAGMGQVLYFPVQTASEAASLSSQDGWDRSPRPLITGWTDLDTEAMRRG